MGNIDLSTGIVTIKQIPLDAKLFVKTLAELSSLGLNSNLAYKYYEKMVVFCAETDLYYQWREERSVGEVGGVVSPSFTYPNGISTDGVDYGLRTFNLFLFIPPQEQSKGNGTCEVWGNTFTHRKSNGKNGDGVIELYDMAFNGLAKDNPNSLVKIMVYMNTLNDGDTENEDNWNIIEKI